MQGNAFKVAILGGGPAGIAAALMIRHISDYDVYLFDACLLYTSPSPRDRTRSRMPSSA